MIATIVALQGAQLLRYSTAIPIQSSLMPGAHDLVPDAVLMVIGIWALVSWSSGAYPVNGWRGGFQETVAMLRGYCTCALVSAGALYLSFRDVPRLMFLYFLAIELVFLLSNRWLVSGAARSRWLKLPIARVAVVGTDAAAHDTATLIRRRGGRGVRFVGFIGTEDDNPIGSLGQSRDICDIVARDQLTHLVVSSRAALSEAVGLRNQLDSAPVTVLVKPDAVNLAFERAGFSEFCGMTLLDVRPSSLRASQRAVKRSMDVLLVLLSLPLALPVMLVTSIIIRLDSPGPVLFRQTRVGEGNRLFTMLKFRTMTAAQHPDQDNGPHKRRNDPRVTRFGKFLRSTSLDELPQLWNILTGDMSVVGPRPEMPYMVQQYKDWQYQRFAVPPGLTGWWQINGRSDRPMHEHTEDDIYYIRHYSPWLDLLILAKTIPAVLSRRGAF